MLKKLKKVLSLVAVALFVTLAVTGCALFERDADYYNQMLIASVGSDIHIYKKDLVDAYSNWGYRYASEYGMTPAKAVEQTAESLVDREIMGKYSIQKFGTKLTSQEESQIRKTAYDAIDNSIKTFEKKIREDMKIDNKADEAKEETPNDSIYKPYTKEIEKAPFKYEAQKFEAVQKSNGDIVSEPLYKLIGGGEGFEGDPDLQLDGNGKPIPVMTSGVVDYRLNLSKYEKTEHGVMPFEGLTRDEANEKYFETAFMARGDGTSDNTTEKLIADKAKERLIKFLENNETGLRHLKGGTGDKAVLIRELERIQSEETKNVYAKRLRDCFELGITTKVDFEIYQIRHSSATAWTQFENHIAYRNQTQLDGIVKRAEEKFKSEIRLAVDRYDKGIDTAASIGEQLLQTNGLSGVRFVPQSLTNEYFTVSHVLLKFSDEQTAKLKELEKDLSEGKINVKAYEQERDKVRSQLRVRERDADRNETGTARSAEDIYLSIRDAIGPEFGTKITVDPWTKQQLAQPKTYDWSRDEADRKINAFHQMIYKYNPDGEMTNAEYEYVIGLNDSKMVEEFTDASRDLFRDKKTKNRTFATGSMTGLVWTEFGAHIIMYTRNLDDFIFHNVAGAINTEFEKFLYATQTSYGNKTVFDSIIENIQRPEYDTYEKSLVSTYKNSNGGMTLYKRNYKDLLKR